MILFERKIRQKVSGGRWIASGLSRHSTIQLNAHLLSGETGQKAWASGRLDFCQGRRLSGSFSFLNFKFFVDNSPDLTKLPLWIRNTEEKCRNWQNNQVIKEETETKLNYGLGNVKIFEESELHKCKKWFKWKLLLRQKEPRSGRVYQVTNVQIESGTPG